ncbi:hypothetical protein FSP39_005732 [Pinctada imbricata]|uniref:EGF-like domain-containing protein n=1 Tax=Pinctada imbricata TaxID=66713 RepID=A0AA88YB39_PINIB|nr:hypothetical protein FSP39_005732 [Pinctada imbricata]
MKVKHHGNLYMNHAAIYSSYGWIESKGVFHLNGHGHAAESGFGAGYTESGEGYGAGHGGYGGGPIPNATVEPYGSLVTPHDAGSGGGNGNGVGGSGGGILYWELGQYLELNGLLALQGTDGSGGNAGGGSGGSLNVKATNFTGHGEINFRGGDGVGTGGGGAGGRGAIHCRWRYSYGGKYTNRGGSGGPNHELSHGAAAGTTYVENNYRPLEYRILKYMKGTNNTYFRVDHLYVHMDNVGLAVPVATVVMEDQTTEFEFDEMEVTGASRVLIYHPMGSKVKLVAHRLMGDRTGQIHMRKDQQVFVEYVESLTNVTEAPVSYIIDYGSEVIFPTEIHMQGVNTTFSGLMTGVHHFYTEDKAVVLVEATSQTALLENGNYSYISDEGNFSLPTINIKMDGVLEFRRIINDFTITASFMELKYKANVYMNHGTIDAGELDLESEAQINLDGKGHKASQGPGAGTSTIGGSYGGVAGGASDGKPYGSLFTPIDLGSGGGGSLGGSGGGFINLKIGRRCHIDGAVKSYGYDAGTNCGGGSGGSIFVEAYNFSGHGVLDASGGDGEGSGNGGSGGRIALHISARNIYGGQYLAHGGTGGSSTNHTISDGGPGTIYKYESARGPTYRDLKYNPRLNATLIQPEHRKLTVENADLKTINPAMVMENNSIYYEFDEVQVEGYAYVHFYHPTGVHNVTVIIHELTGNKKGMVRVQSRQQVIIHYVESTNTYLDAPCGFHVDSGGEIVLPTDVYITAERTILAGRMIGVEHFVIERQAEFLIMEHAHTKDIKSLTLWYTDSGAQSYTPGLVEISDVIINNKGILTLLIDPLSPTLSSGTTTVKNGGIVQTDTMSVHFITADLDIEKGGFIDGEGHGYGKGQGLGAGGTGSHDSAGGSYASQGSGSYNGASAGSPYGPVIHVVEPGSGGGGSHGGAGGSFIMFNIGKTMTVDGVISVNGEDGLQSTENSGGGSGGGIHIDTHSLLGQGSITANGGTAYGGTTTHYDYANGGGSGGRISVYLPEYLRFKGQLVATGGQGHNHGGPGTVYVKTEFGQTFHDQVWVDNVNRGSENTCNHPVILDAPHLTVLHLQNRACTKLGMPTLILDHLAVGTGLLYVEDGKLVTIAPDEVRTHIDANLHGTALSEIVLPPTVYVEATFTNEGKLTGVEHLYTRHHTILKSTGESICLSSAVSLTSWYYFISVTVLDNGKLTVENDGHDTESGLYISADFYNIEYRGILEVTRAVTFVGGVFELEKETTILGDHLGYSAGTGPGTGSNCGGGIGAGHGGTGGKGKSCSSSCSGGATYNNMHYPTQSGSGGGACSGGNSGGAGGSAVRISTSLASYLEGTVTMNGESGSGAGGGGSGGSIWVDSDVIDGWGILHADGGSSSSDCHGAWCCSHYGGGGAGGRIRSSSTNYTNYMVIHQRSVSGASGPGGAGSSGTVSQYHHGHCSNHGLYSNGVCACAAGFVGVDCQYRCNATTTCNGHGTCSVFGTCHCNTGYVGARCESQCHRDTTCSGNGTCTACGGCVCDACFHGSDCSSMCSGFGQCKGGQCQCDACHIGDFCESECNGHGACGSNGTCVCDPNWYGDKCTIKGCPTQTADECSGNGLCNAYSGVCYCNPGWEGADCGTPDCAGEPNCEGRGHCNTTYEPPKCTDCEVGWTGRSCNDPCIHGRPDHTWLLCICNTTCHHGAGCDIECSGNGACDTNYDCYCDPLTGWSGTYCEVPGCPRNPVTDVECSNHGDCNSQTKECKCDRGWTGAACHIADCPGEPDCYNRGVCNDKLVEPKCHNCSEGWMGEACNDPCVNGTETPRNSGNCVCDEGYAGVGCNSECSGHGSIINGFCECYYVGGWKGRLCDIPGCPGLNKLDCSGRGGCDSTSAVCTCHPGWYGIGCEYADCPGTPDCNRNGNCDGTVNPPVCRCDAKHFGAACEEECLNGVLNPVDNCTCDPGWTGLNCDSMCSEHGTIVNGKCVCDVNWRGTVCENPGCPGKGCNAECNDHGSCVGGTCVCDVAWRGSLCEVRGCPGTKHDCSLHGVCNSATQICTCVPGWTGDACDIPDCPGGCFGQNGFCNGTDRSLPECECSTGWMGDDCGKPCIHGWPDSSHFCHCDPCYTGAGCELECSGNGICGNESKCDCFTTQVGNSWVGDLCENRGCPGLDGACNAHGTCNPTLGMCSCYPGWKGDDCASPSCPTDSVGNECSGTTHGICGQGGVCQCNANWVGSYCHIPCYNGTNINGICMCDKDCITGISCHLECSSHGTCDTNGECVCDFYEGYKGDTCSDDGCPGWPTNCMGHGTCNIATKTCQCDLYWGGSACEVPDCPGTPDCNGITAICDVPPGGGDPRCQNCAHPYMGDGCELKCVHGTPERLSTGQWLCHCDPCYSGSECNTQCSGTGTCVNGTCDCGFNGGRGTLCEKAGCPGYVDDCTNHGTCNPATGQCSCNSGWSGNGCHIASCPQDCNSHGTCTATLTTVTPYCTCSTNYFGHACQYHCEHGTYDSVSDVCVCDPCYDGYECNVLCSGTGTCVNGTCDCGFNGGRGDFCEQPGCPGYNEDCTGHGTCNVATGTCLCYQGWRDTGCQTPDCPSDCNNRGVCNTTLSRPACTDCDKGWMGDACDIPCHGTQIPMDSGVCVCDNGCDHGDSCEQTCNGIGQCISDQCDCTNQTLGLNLGHWGDYCTDPGCPGNVEQCTGHGSCVPGSWTCVCSTGWFGDGCEKADCPGTPDCSGNGYCDTSPSNPVPSCVCDPGFMGYDCSLRCINGTAEYDTTTSQFVCQCDPCISGTACDQLCGGHGSCDNGQCTCDTAWWGSHCADRGCPGTGSSCSGRGICTLSDQTCSCDNYWKGDGCDIPDCPGDPDCNNLGYCDGVNHYPAKCINCTLSMGPACEYPCVHGIENPPDSIRCECEPCYSDAGCQTECSNHGSCAANQTTCLCEAGYKGDKCEQLDCPGEPDCSDYGTCIRTGNESTCVCNPGFGGDDCSILLCPGTPDCNNNGQWLVLQHHCVSVTMDLVAWPVIHVYQSLHFCFIGQCLVPVGATAPLCQCDHGFDGLACDTCLPKFTGTSCELCETNYIGYNTTCTTYCVHGYATLLGGDICECYDDDTNGHWTGTGCDTCQSGWNPPTCTQCTPDFVGPGHCSIPCTYNQGSYGDRLDGSGGKEAIEPIFHCYTVNNNQYTAWFGYNNPNSHNVYITEEFENHIDVTGTTLSVIPPTMFEPGQVNYTTAVGPVSATDSVKWTLLTAAANEILEVDANFSAPYLCPVTPELHYVLNASTGYCKCMDGYWGDLCENSCPGGATDPCYGNGACDPATGACTCNEGADVNHDCSQCKTGWFGDDCSVAYTSNDNKIGSYYDGQIYSSGHYRTFDGAIYNYHKPGEHLLVSASLSSGTSIKVHVEQVITSNLYNSVETVAVGVSVGSQTLVLAVTTESEVSAWFDGQYEGVAKTIQSVLLSGDDILYYYNLWHKDYSSSLRAQISSVSTMTTGYGLLINDGFFTTSRFADVHLSGTYLSIETRLNVHSVSLTGGSGVVLSYAFYDTFAVSIMDGKFQVQFGGTDFPTDIPVSTGQWTQITLVYNQVTGVLIFHYIYNGDWTVNTYINVGTGCFPIGGSLAVGGWQVSLSGRGSNPGGVFVGEIDRLIIYSVPISSSQMILHWHTAVTYEVGIVMGWNFNEGYGSFSYDFVSRQVISLAKAGVTWVPSTCSLSRPDNPSIRISIEVDKHPDVEALCSRFLLSGSMSTTCGAVSTLAKFYYTSCYNDVSTLTNHQFNNSMDSVLAFSAICETDRGLTDSPARLLCNDFSERHFPMWTGIDCTMEVTVPVMEPSPLLPSKRNCKVNSRTRYTNFTGHTTKNKETGTFRVLQQGNFLVEATFISCMRDKKLITCLGSLAIQLHNTTIIAMRNPNITTRVNQGYFFINGVKTKVNRKASPMTVDVPGGCPFTITRKNRYRWNITSDSLGVVITVRWGFSSERLFGYFYVDDPFCCNGVTQYGLCGSCASSCGSTVSSPACGVAISSGSSGGTPTVSPPTDSGSIPDNTSIVMETGVSTTAVTGLGPANCLCFERSSIIGRQLPIFNQSDDVTIEFFVKTCTGSDCSGTILSYTETKTFTVKNMEGRIIITMGDQEYDTTLTLENEEWNQLSLVYSYGYMDIYYFDHNGFSARAFIDFTQQFPDYTLVFNSTGSLVIGRWQPPTDGLGPQPTNDNFKGCIDELRIWSRYFSFPDIREHWNVTYSADNTSMEALWKFDEIFQINTVYDEVSSLALNGPYTPFPGGELQQSDAPIPAIIISYDLPGNTAVAGRKRRSTVVTINSLCTNVFVTSTMADTTCSNLGQTLEDFYLYECTTAVDEADILDAILDYSDYCRYVNALSNDPYESLCGDLSYSTYFTQTIMGGYCDPQCEYGTKDTSNTCICIDGYWNITCDTECPGGATQPCSGYGTCNQTTGVCNCPVNRQTSEDCSTCSDGWIGDNCEIAATNMTQPSTSIAVSTRLGHVHNLDGLNFIIQEAAEYVLLTISDKVLVVGKFVSCNQNFTCVTFISARIGDAVNGFATITVQHPRDESVKPLIYIEGVQTTLDSKKYYHGFTIEQNQMDVVLLTINSNLEIAIRLEGRYLDMRVSLPTTMVPLTSGVMSGSGSTNSTEKLYHLLYTDVYAFNVSSSTAPTQTALSSASASTLTLSSVTISQTVTSTNTLDTSKFKVSSEDRIIYYAAAEYEQQGVGGYSLKFDFTSVYINMDLKNITGENITFEFIVKVQNETGGVLFSYTNDRYFLLVAGNTIEIQYDEGTIDTGVELEMDIWNKIVVMYISSTGELELYCFNSTGYINRRTYTITTHIFDNTGMLSIGHWQPPSSGVPFSHPQSFAGQIDNFLIWHIPIEANIITDIYQIDPLDVHHLLSTVWLFDEGVGETTTDWLSNVVIQLPVSPWLPPTWEPSDMSYNKQVFPEISYVYFSDQSLQTTAENTCSVLTDTSTTLGSQCSAMTEATKEAYYTACLQTYSSTHDLAASYDVLLNFAELCENYLGLGSPTPATTLCNSLALNIKVKTSCTRTCLFGEETSSGTCMCVSGHYGSTCQSVCPGGSLYPCNNHGTCESAGTCTCDWNWSGNSQCGTCHSGLSGTECNVLSISALRDSSNTNYVAHISGKADFMTFGGKQIQLEDLSGVYTVMSTATFTIDVYQVSCHIGSCVIAMSVLTGSDSIVVVPSGNDNTPPLIYNNQVMVDVKSLSFSVTGFTVELTSISQVKITVSSTSIHLTVSQQLMDIYIISSSSDCGTSTGVFDQCTGGPSIDYTLYPNDEIDAIINSNYRITSGALIDTLYSIYEDDVSNGAGFTLLFNNTAAVSEAIHYTSDVLDETSFSLSVYYKPTNQEGVVMSYSGNTTFTIMNTNPLTLQCGDSTITTSVNPGTGIWNQLVLTWKNNSLTGQNEIHLYHYGTNSSVSYQILSTSCTDVFQEGGVISLGEWVPSYSSAKRTVSGTFQGYVDEVSIWKDPIPSAMIFQAQSLNVKLSGFTNNVSALYTFAEAVGTTVFDNVFDNNIEIPYSPWQAPIWRVSDLQLLTLPTGHKVDTVITADATTFCANFFDNSALSTNCPGQDSDRTWWFKKQCEELASFTGNVSYGIVSMVTYVTTCEATKSVATQPLFQMICDLNVTTPHWITQQCQDCKFGFWNVTATKCTCYSGYYGTQCDGLCPNGAETPCNNHGVCDTSGACQCSDHWTGTACESCMNGWQGDECTYLTTGHGLSSSPLVAQITTTGQVITFDGVMIVVKSPDTYQLFTDSAVDLRLHGVFSACIDQTSTDLCLNAIVVQISGEYYYIKTESFQTTRVVIYSTSGDTNVYASATVNTMTVQVTSTNVISVTFSNLDITLKVTFINSRLMVLVNLDTIVWNSHSTTIDGLITSCDTITAIHLSTCTVTRLEICSGTATRSSHSSCSSQSTWATIGTFIDIFKSNDSSINSYLNSESVTTASSCMQFSGTGIYTDGLLFPTGHFTIEISVKPTQYGGVILSYQYQTYYIIVIHSSGGLTVILNGIIHITSLEISLNTWTQISLAWRYDVSILELYVTSSVGITTVKALSCPQSVFSTSGSMYIGVLCPGIPTPAISTGTFVGYIDEIRIWSRPYNPAVLTRNWRLLVSENTPDLSHSWTLNDGSGWIASETQSGQHMYVTDTSNPPAWVASDLDLQADFSLVTHNTTDTDPAAAVSTTTCDTLFNSASVTSQLAGLENVTSALYEQCKSLVSASGNDSVAEVLLLTLSGLGADVNNLIDSPASDMCNDISTYSSYVTTYGTSCSSTCVFGTSTLTSCTCDSSHWGSNCSSTCQLGTNGACNSQGSCSSTTGECTCTRHWLSVSYTTLIYWNNYLVSSSYSVTISSFACDTCSGGWYSSDCLVAVQSTASVRNYMGLIFGTYIMTLDGASYSVTTPGLYQVLQSGSLSIQVLFWPCPGDLTCRYLREVTISNGQGALSVIGTMSGDMTLYQGSSEISTFPYETTNQGIAVKWIFSDYIRFTVGSTTFVVSNSTIGLICRFKASSGEGGSGILGRADKNWWNDLLSPTENTISNSTVAESTISVPYIGEWTKSSYSTSLSNPHMYHASNQQYLSSAGYLLRLTNQTVSFTGVYTTVDISQFTLSFWIRIQGQVSTSTQVMVITTNSHALQIVLVQGVVQIIWSQTYLTQTMVLPYSAVLTPGDTYNMDGLTLSGNTDAYVEIEHIRAWNQVRDLNTIIGDRDIYTDTNTNNLLFSVPMDEGEGLSTQLTDHSGVSKRSVPGTISGQDYGDLWQPSDIPIKNTYTRDYPQPSATNSSVLDECLEALNDSTVKTHCQNVDNLSGFLLEACIADYDRLGDKATNETIILNLIFYCQGAFDVDECKLDGYFDYCTTEVDTESEDNILWIIIAIVICVIILCMTLICCCCCWYHSKCCFKKCGKKKNKKDHGNQFFVQSEQDDEFDDYYVSNPIFSRSSTQDSDMYVTGIGGHKFHRKMALEDRQDTTSPDSMHTGRLSASGGSTSPVFAPTPGPPGQGPSKLQAISSFMKSPIGPFADVTSEQERAARERIEGKKEGRSTPFSGGAKTPAPFKFPAPPKLMKRSGRKSSAPGTSTSQTFENPLMTFDDPSDDTRPTSAESKSSRDVKFSPFVPASFDGEIDSGETNPFQPQTNEEILAEANRRSRSISPSNLQGHSNVGNRKQTPTLTGTAKAHIKRDPFSPEPLHSDNSKKANIRSGPLAQPDEGGWLAAGGRRKRKDKTEIIQTAPDDTNLSEEDEEPKEDVTQRHKMKVDNSSGFAYIADSFEDTFGMFNKVSIPKMAQKAKFKKSTVTPYVPPEDYSTSEDEIDLPEIDYETGSESLLDSDEERP